MKLRERVTADWELIGLLLLAVMVYQPWSASVLPILDFSEFLPQLAAQETAFGQYGAVAKYMESQGRFCPLLYAHVVIAWNAFGMWAPGWHWTYVALIGGVLVAGRALLIEMGVKRVAVLGALALWTIAPPVAAGAVRLTGELTGLLFFIGAMRLAHGYADAADWKRRAVMIAACLVAMIAAKEMLAVLFPGVWLMTRLSHRDGKWEWASWTQRDVTAVAWSAPAVVTALLPVAVVAMNAPAGSYAARYGTGSLDFPSIILRLETALLPSRAGLPSATQLINDASWQSWLTLPNLLWLALLGAGLIALSRGRAHRGVKWPMLIGAMWALSGVAAYLPWPSQAPFYMMPFAFGVAVVVAYALHALLRSRPVGALSLTAVVFIAAIGAVEARDIVNEHELRVATDARVLSTIAYRGRTLPLVAAVPEPMPAGAFGWGRKLGDYGRVTGDVAPRYARDVSCAEGRRLLKNAEQVVVVSASNGCGPLSPGSVVISETVPRRRWPWLFEGRTNRRVNFVAIGTERRISSAGTEQ